MEISKEEKQKYADEYFNGINRKELREFKATTPEGHTIHGYICNKHNHLLGSLLILKVDGEENIQFIQSFPKIKYYEHISQLNINSKHHYCFEKLDGSCLIIYPLRLNDGGIEYVVKTRGMPVADPHFQDLYNSLSHKKIEDYYNSDKNKYDTLVFELYGTSNQHEIYYKDVELDLRLIGLFKEGKWLNGSQLRFISKLYFYENIPLFTIEYDLTDETYKLCIVPDSFLDNLGYTSDIFVDNNLKDIAEAIQAIKLTMDKINEESEAPLIEGVVINTIRSNGYQNYIKIKTSNIELKHRSENGIPKADIIKELNKYFDDNQSQIKELYEADKNCYWPYVSEMLLEDYPIEYVDNPKTKNKASKLFLKVWDARMPSPELDEITDNLINDYPNGDVVDLIRLFAQKYPQLKKQSGKVYSLLEVKLNKK